MESSFFVQNRLNISESTGGGVVIISAYTQVQRGNDAAFDFEQEGTFGG